MKIAFIHPDLGIGGAERLIVDAASGLQRLGHTVHIYTSHHDPNHCFEETKDGTLTVRHIRPPFPRAILGKGHILFAHLRQLHLILNLLIFGGVYDVFLVDQLATCIPLIRGLAHKRVVFYGHFPDKLLAHGQFIEGSTGRPRPFSIKGIYRIPMDWLEEVTTRQTDVLLVNSKFTARVFKTYFTTITQEPRVVYPGLNIEAYDKPVKHDSQTVGDVYSNRPTLLSINRFEKKKNAALAVEAFARVRSQLTSQDKPHDLDALRLVLAGGYDPRLQDNIDTLTQLAEICQAHALTYHITPPLSSTDSKKVTPATSADVVFLLNFTQEQRTWLLTSPTTQALLYTPTNEHFGIIPVEGMVSSLPVLACDSGGPTESILDPDFSSTHPDSESESGRTGWLRPPNADAWSAAILEILRLSEEERRAVGERARHRAVTQFSLDATAKRFEGALQEAIRMERVPEGMIYWYMLMVSIIVFASSLWQYYST